MSRIVTHIALHVHDLQVSMNFYAEWGGMWDRTPISEQGSAWMMSEGCEGRFALVLVPGAPDAPDPHRPANDDPMKMSIAVESLQVLEEMYERAQMKDLLVEEFTESADGRRATFSMQDPDANVVEFVKMRQPNLKRKFNGVSLVVDDLDVSLDFYHQWCGMVVNPHGTNEQRVRLVSPGNEKFFTLTLVDGDNKGSPRPANDISHIGVAVETEVEWDHIYQQAKQAGIVTWEKMHFPYPIGDLFITHDPDHNGVEFSTNQPLGGFSVRGPQ